MDWNIQRILESNIIILGLEAEYGIDAIITFGNGSLQWWNSDGDGNYEAVEILSIPDFDMNSPATYLVGEALEWVNDTLDEDLSD